MIGATPDSSDLSGAQGFREEDRDELVRTADRLSRGEQAETRSRLKLENGRLHSLVNGRSYGVGTLELVLLAELRERTRGISVPGQLRLGIAQGDVRAMHLEPRNAGALFQVASQFNLLEMVSPAVTPEDGVGGYEDDHTQGPACAIAAGAGTIYRNYLVPVGDQLGQSRERQLDGLADLGRALGEALGVPAESLWHMQNGYALPSRESLERIAEHLQTRSPHELDQLRGFLRVGLHGDVEITDGGQSPGPLVSQIYCSALPVAYAGHSGVLWSEFAHLVLDAAYEATLLAGVLNAARGASNRVLLTRLGGGAFGNDDAWVDAAILRALRLVRNRDLQVEVVSYGAPSTRLRNLVQSFADRAVR